MTCPARPSEGCSHAPPFRRYRLWMLLSALAIIGCSDLPTGSRPDHTPQSTLLAAADGAPYDRKDTPWQKLDNAAFIVEMAKVNNRVIIGLKDSSAVEGVDNSGRVVASAAGVREAKAHLRALGIQFLYEFKITPVVVARISTGLVAALRASPWVDYVEPVARGEWADSPQVTPWNIQQVQAPSAWPVSTGSGVKLLIMDSGIMWAHEDLNPYFAWRCVDGSQPIEDRVGHGTHVAGIAAAVNNNLDVVGVGHSVYLASANVEEGGAPVTDEVACSIEVARANGIFSTNMSLSVPPSTAITDQIRAGWNEGFLYVAAAGNTNGGSVSYPARLAEVIAVTATDINNVRASFAAIGPEIDIAAPGVDILSTALPTGYSCASGGLIAYCSGTSMAAPHVAGAAAIIKARFPYMSNLDVRNRLLSTALPLGPSNQYGAGLLQTATAVGPPPPTYSLSVSIDGPTQIRPGATCTWYAAVSGGTSPYSYQWTASQMAPPSGTDYYFTASKDQGSLATSWLMKVVVTDAAGGAGEHEITVYENPSAMVCAF